MGREVLKTPDWWHWPADWIAGIKTRTGMTDAQLAEKLGMSTRNLDYIKKNAYQGRSGKVLRLYAMYLDAKGEEKP